MFFQFVMCISIWLSGMIIHAVREFPKMYGFSILAGVIQTLANFLSVIIIKFIGVGLGNVYWNTISKNKYLNYFQKSLFLMKDNFNINPGSRMK